MGSALMKSEPLPDAPGGRMREARYVRAYDLPQAAERLEVDAAYLWEVEENRALFTKSLRERAVLVYGFPLHFFDQPLRDSFGRIFHISGEGVASCRECPYVADYLCDFPMGGGKTCDIPLCDEHAAEIQEDMHFCPQHVAITNNS